MKTFLKQISSNFSFFLWKYRKSWKPAWLFCTYSDQAPRPCGWYLIWFDGKQLNLWPGLQRSRGRSHQWAEAARLRGRSVATDMTPAARPGHTQRIHSHSSLYILWQKLLHCTHKIAIPTCRFPGKIVSSNCTITFAIQHKLCKQLKFAFHLPCTIGTVHFKANFQLTILIQQLKFTPGNV